jgi:hypothetical protein
LFIAPVKIAGQPARLRTLPGRSQPPCPPRRQEERWNQLALFLRAEVATQPSRDRAHV